MTMWGTVASFLGHPVFVWNQLRFSGNPPNNLEGSEAIKKKSSRHSGKSSKQILKYKVVGPKNILISKTFRTRKNFPESIARALTRYFCLCAHDVLFCPVFVNLHCQLYAGPVISVIWTQHWNCTNLTIIKLRSQSNLSICEHFNVFGPFALPKLSRQ